MNLPSAELLEERHEFPCPFTFKIIGTADDNFTARIVAQVREELNRSLLYRDSASLSNITRLIKNIYF